MTRQVELLNDLRPQERDDVGADRIAEAGKELFCDGGSAEDVPPLEYQHLPARAREVCGSREAVVPAPNDDCVITHRGPNYNAPWEEEQYEAIATPAALAVDSWLVACGGRHLRSGTDGPANI